MKVCFFFFSFSFISFPVQPNSLPVWWWYATVFSFIYLFIVFIWESKIEVKRLLLLLCFAVDFWRIVLLWSVWSVCLFVCLGVLYLFLLVFAIITGLHTCHSATTVPWHGISQNCFCFLLPSLPSSLFSLLSSLFYFAKFCLILVGFRDYGATSFFPLFPSMYRLVLLF